MLLSEARECCNCAEAWPRVLSAAPFTLDYSNINKQVCIPFLTRKRRQEVHASEVYLDQACVVDKSMGAPTCNKSHYRCRNTSQTRSWHAGSAVWPVSYFVSSQQIHLISLKRYTLWSFYRFGCAEGCGKSLWCPCDWEICRFTLGFLHLFIHVMTPKCNALLTWEWETAAGAVLWSCCCHMTPPIVSSSQSPSW